MLTVIRAFWRYLRPYKLLTSLFAVTLLLDMAFISLAPLSFKFMIDKAVEPRDADYFWLILQVLGVVGVICLSAAVISDYALAKLISRVHTDLRRKLFVQMQHVHIGFYHQKRAGDFASYFSVDLPGIVGAMHSVMTMGIQSLIVVTVSTAALFYLQWSMALLIMAGAVVIFVGPYMLGGRAQAVYADYKRQLAALTSDVQENAKAQKVVKGFNLQTAVMEKFESRLQSLFVSNYRRNTMIARLERIPMVSLLLINFTIIGFGSYLALKGHITVGALVAFFTMYTSMGNSVFNLTYVIPLFADTKVSMERIDELLNAPVEENGAAGSGAGIGASGPLSHGQIRLGAHRVTFGYREDQPVLRRVSLDIPAGTTAAFVGSSGSGKSTMLQLLLGFYKPAEGDIRINGADLRSLDLRDYRERIGIVFQDSFLFNGTILDNIRISKPAATLEEVIGAAKQAEIHEYISGLPDGYETALLDEGANLSGGQRQRLAIARAILRNPPILLLDEATSALDPISEASINRTFEKLARDRTVVMVTHRLASISGVDCIHVFDRGELLESGSHAELLEREGFYHKLWEKQSGLEVSEDGQEATIDTGRLSRLPFFQGVDRSVLNGIAGMFHTETYAAGQTVIREGEPGDKFYLIARGRVEVSRQPPDPTADKVRLAVLEDGDHFGEIALLDNVPRTATITTLTSCVLLTLQRKALYHMLSQHPAIDDYVRSTLRARKS